MNGDFVLFTNWNDLEQKLFVKQRSLSDALNSKTRIDPIIEKEKTLQTFSYNDKLD